MLTGDIEYNANKKRKNQNVSISEQSVEDEIAAFEAELAAELS